MWFGYYGLFLKQVVGISSVLCKINVMFLLFRMNTACLKSICEVLDLERGGKKEDILDRLINFLMKPKSSGKALPKKSMY